MTVLQDATHALVKLATFGQTPGDTKRGRYVFEGGELAKLTGLDPDRLNDAVEVLESNGYADVLRFLGTAPFAFGQVELTARGRVEAERLVSANKAAAGQAPTSGAGSAPGVVAQSPLPVGSPYGFRDEDWEAVSRSRDDKAKLVVVFGHQWKSAFFDADQLRQNVGAMFANALSRALAHRPGAAMLVDYRPLQGGYGDHLFNEIARDIISADIAVFDTSDSNPNVMIEMGVALTWGIRVLPIRATGSPKPPSDISGQTWAEYEQHGLRWSDPAHVDKLASMVERAARKKLAI